MTKGIAYLEKQFRRAVEDLEALGEMVGDPSLGEIVGDPSPVDGRTSPIVRESITRLDRAVKRLVEWVEGR
jgi:hypothetical protein